MVAGLHCGHGFTDSRWCPICKENDGGTNVKETYGPCVDCRTYAEDVQWRACPYASDLRGDDTPMWLCDHCYRERADEL